MWYVKLYANLNEIIRICRTYELVTFKGPQRYRLVYGRIATEVPIYSIGKNFVPDFSCGMYKFLTS